MKLQVDANEHLIQESWELLTFLDVGHHSGNPKKNCFLRWFIWLLCFEKTLKKHLQFLQWSVSVAVPLMTPSHPCASWAQLKVHSSKLSRARRPRPSPRPPGLGPPANGGGPWPLLAAGPNSSGSNLKGTSHFFWPRKQRWGSWGFSFKTRFLFLVIPKSNFLHHQIKKKSRRSYLLAGFNHLEHMFNELYWIIYFIIEKSRKVTKRIKKQMFQTFQTTNQFPLWVTTENCQRPRNSGPP